MSCKSRSCINIVTLIIAVIIFVQTNFLTIMILTLKYSEKEISVTKEEKQEIASIEEKNTWKLEIPKLNLCANIKEGTSGEIINNYVGHFEETPNENGNIGLIAASSGYKENYFSNLKDLQQGDIIRYEIGNNKKEYAVATNTVIEQTDWSYLSNTQDNKLTLITGITEEPKKRVCVQAIEIQGGIK